MARGRPRLSAEDKAARKERKEEAKAAFIAENALAKMPAEAEKRNELFLERDDLDEAKKAAGSALAAQNKRMSEVFGLTKPAMKIRDILAKCRDGVYEATVQQIGILVTDMGRPFQLSMFSGTPGLGATEAPGTVFDNTTAGQRQKDVTPKAAKTKEPPAAPVDTGKLEPDEALKAFEAANETAAKKRAGKKTPPPAPAPVAAADADDDRPRHLRQNEHDRQPPSGFQGLGPDAIH